ADGVMSTPHDPAAAVNFRLLRQHENEFVRQLREHALRHGKTRPGDGHVTQVAGADRFAVLGVHQHIPSQWLTGTATALDGHICNLRTFILFAKSLTAGYWFTAPEGAMPKLDRVLETALYVDDLGRAAAFYAELFELASLYADERLRAFAVGGTSVLLLF